MRTWERWGLNLLSLAVATSGFSYLWMKYFMTNDDPFALVNHPWQPAVLHIHVLASPALILNFGIVLNSHVLKKLRAVSTSNRKTGLVAFATFGTLTCSGYLLQVVTSDAWLQALVTAHTASGVLFVGAYSIHLVMSVLIARRRSASSLAREVA